MGQGQIASVLIADPVTGFRNRLANDFVNSGVEVRLATTLRALRRAVGMRAPDVVLLELELLDGTWKEALDIMSGVRSRVVILANSGSIATAVSAIKAGVDDYIIKPVSARQILHRLSPIRSALPTIGNDAGAWSLDRAVGEILCQAVESCGSISAAARMLRIHRRSLQRKLDKLPPTLRRNLAVDRT